MGGVGDLSYVMRRARGDWQTPPALAGEVVALLERPGSVVETTCGRGNFLRAASEAWPRVPLYGLERQLGHALAAARVKGARIQRADFFEVDWTAYLAAREGPVLVLGNPPWVNRDTLGVLGAHNGRDLPRLDGVRGLDAITGAGNFDVSEYMTLALLRALPPQGSLALLLKRSVAHRLLPRLPELGLDGAVHTIDARSHFGVAVDAVLFQARPGTGEARWADHGALGGPVRRWLGLVDGQLVPDVEGALSTQHLAGSGAGWRSGLKHDCAEVFELEAVGEQWRARDGSVLMLESSHVFPLLKGGDLHHQRAVHRGVVLPQRHPGQDTKSLAREAPAVHAWLQRHRARLDARRSRIYQGAPPFAIFGIGPYSFAPWKVAVSALHKTLGFRVVGPHEGQPVLFDDTCVFLGFDEEQAARDAHHWLTDGPGAAYLNARVFWEAKRPLTTRLLGGLVLP